MYLPFDFSDLADGDLKARAIQIREDILNRSVLTAGGAGEANFSREKEGNSIVMYTALLREMIKRQLTDVSPPITVARGRFLDPIAPF